MKYICSGMVFCGVGDPYSCYHCVPHEHDHTCKITACDGMVDKIKIYCVPIREKKHDVPSRKEKRNEV